jgi:hypothetical protein
MAVKSVHDVVAVVNYILRDIDIELWSKVKAKATLERKTMREVIFESLKWYVMPVETSPPNKRTKGKKKPD